MLGTVLQSSGATLTGSGAPLGGVTSTGIKPGGPLQKFADIKTAKANKTAADKAVSDATATKAATG